MDIRIASTTDMDGLSLLIRKLALESSFMLFEPDEVPTSVRLSKRLLSAKNEHILLATEGNSILGYLVLSQGVFKRNSGVGTIAIGVESSEQGRGVGSSLMSSAVTLATELELYRLQLYVQTSNHKALKLYRKFGFEVEGTLIAAAKVNGLLVDKYLMARIL